MFYWTGGHRGMGGCLFLSLFMWVFGNRHQLDGFWNELGVFRNELASFWHELILFPHELG